MDGRKDPQIEIRGRIEKLKMFIEKKWCQADRCLRVSSSIDYHAILERSESVPVRSELMKKSRMG